MGGGDHWVQPMLRSEGWVELADGGRWREMEEGVQRGLVAHVSAQTSTR